jgi:hypothetical protein
LSTTSQPLQAAADKLSADIIRKRLERNCPIHNLFERSCDLWRLTTHKIAEVFGTHLRRSYRGKLSTIIHQIEHGHHVFRAYFKNAVLRQ